MSTVILCVRFERSFSSVCRECVANTSGRWTGAASWVFMLAGGGAVVTRVQSRVRSPLSTRTTCSRPTAATTADLPATSSAQASTGAFVRRSAHARRRRGSAFRPQVRAETARTRNERNSSTTSGRKTSGGRCGSMPWIATWPACPTTSVGSSWRVVLTTSGRRARRRGVLWYRREAGLRRG